MAIDTRRKRQAAAWVGYPGAPSVYPIGGVDSDMRAQVAWSYSTFLFEIVPNALFGSRVLGVPTLLETVAPGNPAYPDLTVYVDGTKRTEYFRVASVSISLSVNQAGTASMTSYDPAGLYVPQRNDPVQIYLGSTLKFSGFVERTSETRMQPKNTSGPVTAQVVCNDLNALFEWNEVAKYYDEFNGGGLFTFIVYDMIYNLNSGALASAGINYLPDSGNNPLISSIVFFYSTVAEALRRLQQIANVDRYVDAEGNLRFFNLSLGGYTSAPGPFTNTLGNWRNFKVNRTRAYNANVVIAKSSRNLGDLHTDTFLGMGNPDGSGMGLYLNTYPLNNNTPVVEVNDVKMRVTLLGAPGDTRTIYGSAAEYDFYTLYDGIGVFYNPTLPALDPGDVVEITYPGPLPFVGFAKDDASIAAIGRRVRIVEAGEIDSRVVLQEIAEQVLARSLQDPIDAEIETDDEGYEPGQLVAINITNPDVNDDFIINATTLEWVPVGRAGGYFKTRIRCSNQDYQEAANPDRYIGTIIERTREKTDRIIDKLAFTLAETIEGFDNPGLTVGVKEAVRRAQKRSMARSISLTFKSIQDGIPTTLDIEVDVFQNGTSIFGPSGVEKLLLRAGESVVVKWDFASNPLIIEEGDIFTFEVLQADSLAKDGFMELVGVG